MKEFAKKMDELDSVLKELFGPEASAAAELDHIIQKMAIEQRPWKELTAAVDEQLQQYQDWRRNWFKISSEKSKQLAKAVMKHTSGSCEERILEFIKAMEHLESKDRYMPHKFSRDDLLEFYQKKQSL